jgi:hypothetical protein
MNYTYGMYKTTTWLAGIRASYGARSYPDDRPV